MVTEKRAYAAAEMLQQFCRDHKCNNCMFGDGSWCALYDDNQAPEYWDLEEVEPEEG
ncbi:MAG: hypothetical protein Q4B26_19155 [Eubacteriales bacterium]|nr:hypothetical protein [Eubacteriales bacterium]